MKRESSITYIMAKSTSSKQFGGLESGGGTELVQGNLQQGGHISM
jgi:hypothetical protein